MPIIANTANAIKGDVDRCMEAGMNDFIGKPVDPDALFATLLTWLSAAGTTRPSSCGASVTR